MRMLSGAVWLASGPVGEATLVDGASAEVKAHVPVAVPGTALSVTHHQDGAAFVLNGKTGALSRIDTATEQVSRPASVLPESDGLVLLPSPDALRVVDVHSGAVAAVDPATLARRGEPEHLAGAVRPGSVVADGLGRVWAIDEATGDLVWLDRGQRRSRATATRSGLLAITQGLPALVDPEHGTAELINPQTGAVRRSLRPDLRAGDAVVVSGSADRSRLLIAVRTRGELISCTFGTGSCAKPVQVGSPGAELGAPVEVGDHAVVPDHSTGQATIVDLATSRVVAQRALFERPTAFELIARDGIVFFNDPNSNKAGVLDLWGTVRTITKYTENPAVDKPTPTPDRSVRADEVRKTGHEKQKIGLGQPHQNSRPDLTASSPAASIVVEPGNSGVAGDEFELTFVLQHAAGATIRWSFGDGTDASGSSVRHTWLEPGVFTVRATATFGEGRRAEAETAVTVVPRGAPPRIISLAVSRPKPVIGEPVHFSADTTREPDRWEWTVTRSGQPAPEVTARTAEFDHRFATPGRYTVALTVTKGSQTAQSSRQFTVARGTVKALTREDWPMIVPPAAESGVIAVAAGETHAVALKTDGRVIAWGPDDTANRLNVPQEATSGVIAISASGEHTLALKTDGSVVAWGGRDGESDVPEEARRGVVAISAGDRHSLALRSDGSVIAWGGTSEESDVPDEARRGVVAIAAGDSTSLALKADGSLVVWGDGPFQDGTPPSISGGVRALALGGSVGLALQEDGSVISWGSRKQKTFRVPEEAQSGVVAIDISHQHALAVKADGTAFGWGLVSYDVDPLPPGTSGVLAVAAGNDFSLILVEGTD
ncbi:hypothetical protein GCM10010178_25470 [Lentzea flava]|uniref:PKD domain-containing protein n=1 Tax=Lentzea flava TaxID=103732 RepID=A0ABQ2UG62_9PSEU|nr:hypothetical protein GCM10010178_25470 [Lentzea flava]